MNRKGSAGIRSSGFPVRKNGFTLIELVVVLAIIGLATSLVMSSFRGESDTLKRERISSEIEAWLAQIRYRAMEQGREYSVCFDEENRRLTADGEYSDGEKETMEENGQILPATLVWKIPEDCTFSIRGDDPGLLATESREILRFYSDGGVGVTLVLVLRCGKDACCFDFSRLTGELILRGGDGENETEPERQTAFRTIEEITGTTGQ